MDALSSLEASVLNKVQTACNYVNAEVVRLRHQTIAIAAVCAAGAMLLWFVTGFGDARIALVVAAGVVSFAFVRARNELASSYKNIAAKRIVAGLGKELKYNHTSSLTRQQFIAMDLFADRCERWSSRDEIAGRTRGVRYSLHRARASAKDRRAPFFEGVIIKIDFGDNFPGHTVILPDSDGRALTGGGNGSNGAASRRKKDLVMLKNPAFERLFDVYSTDYYEARQLVTPKFMEVVIDAQTRLATELRLCFVQKSLFIAVAGGGDSLRFDASLFAEPLTPQAAVGNLMQLVSIAERLAELRS